MSSTLILLVMTIALGCLATRVDGQPQTCVTEANLKSLNDSANVILAEAARLPPQDQNEIMGRICTGYLYGAVHEIQMLIVQCKDLLMEDTSIKNITLDGKTFIDFFNMFGSIDELCDCAPYLENAYMMAAVPLTIKLTDSPVHEVANLTAYCYTNPVHVQGEKNSTKEIIEDVYIHRKDCRTLPMFAGVDIDANLAVALAFIDDRCPRFDAIQFDCAVVMSKMTIFKECMSVASSSTGDGTSEPACMRHGCVLDRMSVCGETAVYNYIFAANNRLMKDQSTDLNPYIRQDMCSAVSNTRLNELIALLIISYKLLMA